MIFYFEFLLRSNGGQQKVFVVMTSLNKWMAPKDYKVDVMHQMALQLVLAILTSRLQINLKLGKSYFFDC